MYVSVDAAKVWYDSADGGVHEVIVNGRRQGVTRQNALKAEARYVCSFVSLYVGRDSL